MTDGDTIKLGGERIRLTCIDAPETNQPYGLESKEYLMKLINGKEIEVVRESKDRYGRTLAWLVVEGDTINYKIDGLLSNTLKSCQSNQMQRSCQYHLRIGVLKIQFFALSLNEEILH